MTPAINYVIVTFCCYDRLSQKNSQRKGLILVHSSTRIESIRKGEGTETSWQQHLEADLATFPSTLRNEKKNRKWVRRG